MKANRVWVCLFRCQFIGCKLKIDPVASEYNQRKKIDCHGANRPVDGESNHVLVAQIMGIQTIACVAETAQEAP